MKNIKIYLIIIIILLLGAIGAGVYVWYTVQSLNAVATDQKKTIESTPQNTSKTNTVSETQKPITITKDSLSSTQQKALETLGYTQDSFTITASMIACAEDAVGKTRLDEIVKGAAPTPLESIKLLPCFKK